MAPLERRIDLAPCATADIARLEAELKVSNVVAQVLARRGFADPVQARAWLEARERHGAAEFCGLDEALALIRRHIDQGSRITVHGDYDVDGVCSTAILVRALRSIGGDVSWYLPSRLEDGYGLSAHTVERLAANGTRLLVTADCAITAVEEVAAARAAGMDVVVTDHHTPRADGTLPDAPIVHPAVCGYPCPHLCAAGVALKVAEALEAPTAAEDLDLAALATVADVVPLTGENRRLVREGLQALATTSKLGLRALMRVAQVDPTRLDAGSIGFRLAPRINAAGRLDRADAGLELVLTEDPDRAVAVADELDRANAERRHVEERILFAAEAQVAEQGERAAYVLAGEDWHPGVIGIVASRIAERHHRPAVLVALDPEKGSGTGSGRSIPPFDLLGGLDACAEHLTRHGGHRAAAGLEVRTENLDAFRAAFEAHAAATLTPDDLVPVSRVDAVAAGGDLGLDLAEELTALAPFGMGNPAPALLVPAARLTDPRPLGEGERHVRFTVEAGGARSRAVAFRCGGRLPVDADTAADAVFALELDDYRGVVRANLVLRHATPCAPAHVSVVGEPADPVDAALAVFEAGLPEAPSPSPADGPATSPYARGPRDRRDRGFAGVVTALTATGERVLVACADARRRERHLAGRLGGFDLCSWPALERDPSLAQGYDHVVALDPPATSSQRAIASALAQTRPVHLAYGVHERAFAAEMLEREGDPRPAAGALYRALRDGTPLERALHEQASPSAAGVALRVLHEVGLVEVDAAHRTARVVEGAARTELDRSPTYRAATQRAREGRALLVRPAASAA